MGNVGEFGSGVGVEPLGDNLKVSLSRNVSLTYLFLKYLDGCVWEELCSTFRYLHVVFKYLTPYNPSRYLLPTNGFLRYDVELQLPVVLLVEKLVNCEPAYNVPVR